MLPLFSRRNDLEDLPTVLEVIAGRRFEPESLWLPLRVALALSSAVLACVGVLVLVVLGGTLAVSAAF